MDFHSMKRKELQELCKNHGIPANLSNVEMANRLSSISKVSETEKPLISRRSCLKAVDEGLGENGSDGVNRKVKKVRFSPENEMFEFTKSNAVRGCRRKSGSVCNVELRQRVVKNSPVRITRSRGLQLLDAEKKVTKSGLNGNDRVEKSSSLSDNEVRVTTRRALRNREVQDEGLRESEGVIHGLRKSERQRNRAPAKGIDDVPQSKQSAVGPRDAIRRSKRTASKKEDTLLASEDVGKNENTKRGRLGRKQAPLEVEVSVLKIDESVENGAALADGGNKISVLKIDESVENGVALADGGNKEAGVITRRSLRNREITVEGEKGDDDDARLRRSGRQNKRGPVVNHEVLESQDIVEEPVKELSRSKRNAMNAKDTVTFDENKNIGKVRSGRNRIKLDVETSKCEAAEDGFALSSASNGENRACTKRLLRNKKIVISEDIDEGLKKTGGQISMRNEIRNEEGFQNKQIEEEVNLVVRRSKRNAAKMDGSQYLYKGIGKSKMVIKEQKTGVEASRLEAMSETKIAALDKNDVGKETAKTQIRSSPQNSVMPLLQNTTKEMETSAFDIQSETETAVESRLEVLIQVEEPTNASPVSPSFDAQFETEIAAENRLEVVSQVEQTSASPRRSSREKPEITLLESVGIVHQNINQDLSSDSTLNASLDVEVLKDDEMSHANELRRSMHKTAMFSSNPSIDEKLGSSKNVANSELTDNSSKSFEEHDGSLPEEINEQCSQVDILSGTSDTETNKEPASPEPLVDEYRLEKNEFEETSHQKNQVSPHKVGDRTGEAEEVKNPQMVSGIGNSCPDLVDVHTDNEVQLVGIPVIESKGFAEIVDISMEVNVEKSLEDLVGPNLAVQEQAEDFNVDRDSASLEANSTVDCYRSNGQSHLTAGVKETQSKELKEIDNASKEDFTGENEMDVIAAPLNRADGENLSTEVSLPEDITSNLEKEPLQIGDCTQVANLSGVEVTDILNEPFKSSSSIDDSTMNSNKFEESAQQSKQVSSPKVGNEKEMEEVKSPQLVNAVDKSCFELVTPHADHVEQEKVLVDELKDFSDKVNISLEGNREKSSSGLVGHILIDLDRDAVPFEINSPTKAYGCNNQLYVTADIKWQSEEVAEVQYSGSLSKEIGSTFKLVEHTVKDENSGGKELAEIAAHSVNSFATFIACNDVLQDSLDDEPEENLEEAGFIDPSQKHKCDASKPEVYAGNAENADAGGYISIAEQFSPVLNKETANTVDWEPLKLEEQLSTMPRNIIEHAFVVEEDEVLTTEYLEDQMNAPDNDGKPSVSDATEAKSEILNGEGSINNVETEHFPPSESKLQKHVHGVNGLESSYTVSVSPSKCSDDEEQEEQFRLLFSTPINDGITCEENSKARNMDSSKASSQFTDANSAGEELRNLFTTSGDVLCPDGSDECSQRAKDQEYQLSSLFSTPTSVRTISKENAKAFTMESEASGLLIEASNAVETALDDDKIALNNDKETEQEDHLRLLFYTPNSVRGIDLESVNASYMDSNQRCGQSIEASNAVQIVSDEDILCSMLALTNAKEHVQELQEDGLLGNVGTDIEEISKSFEPLDAHEQPDARAESSTLSSPKSNFTFEGNVEEKTQKSQVENICTSSKCNYIKKDEDVKAIMDDDHLVANSNLFASPSKYHAIFEERDEAAVIDELDSKSNECTSANEDNIGAITCIGQPLMVAETNEPSSCGLVEPQESNARNALYNNEREDPSTEENECTSKAAEMELHTSEPRLEPTHECTAEIYSDGDKVPAEDSSLSLKNNGSIEIQIAAADVAEKRCGEDGPLECNTEIYPCAEKHYSGAESSTLSTPNLNSFFGENVEEKAQVENACTSSKCNYIEKDEDMKGCPTAIFDNDQLVANINLFASPSKFHAILEGRDEAAAINELDPKSKECTSANEDKIGAIKYIGQPLMVAEMNQPSSCGLVETQESSARTALHHNEREEPSTEENESTVKASEIELHTSEPSLEPTHQSTAEIYSDGDKGSSIFFRELNSSLRKSDKRSILIHATPYKHVRVDMKENAPAAKGELIGTLTAARPEKRRPLKDLQWK